MNIFQFIKETRVELEKVVWPSKKDTLKYTVTVIVFSIGVALILGAFDFGLIKLMEKILTR